AALGQIARELVLEHQLLRAAHRELGLVLVLAAGEGEELAYLLDDPRGGRLAVRRLRPPSGPRIDRALGADAAERRTVRRLVVHAQDLVDELMRELVAQDLHDLTPRPLEDERARELDGPLGADPAAEHLGVSQ